MKLNDSQEDKSQFDSRADVSFATLILESVNQLSAFTTMLVVLFFIWPGFDTITRAVVQQAADVREMKHMADRTSQTLEEILKHMKEPDRWNEANRMINPKK